MFRAFWICCAESSGGGVIDFDRLRARLRFPLTPPSRAPARVGVPSPPPSTTSESESESEITLRADVSTRDGDLG